jgi:hypothetical protein
MLPDLALLVQQLGDLNRIERCALPELISGDPECQTVFEHLVLTDATDATRDDFRVIDRHGIFQVCGIIYEFDTFERFDRSLRSCDADRPFKFGTDLHRVRTEDRHTHTGASDA